MDGINLISIIINKIIVNTILTFFMRILLIFHFQIFIHKFPGHLIRVQKILILQFIIVAGISPISFAITALLIEIIFLYSGYIVVVILIPIFIIIIEIGVSRR